MSHSPMALALRAAILDLRQDYLSRGISLYDIGSGHCYDFAETVMEQVFGTDWLFREGQEGWRTLETEQFYRPPPGSHCTIDATAWDWDLLETHWGIDIPPSERPRYDAIVIQGPSHGWIYLEGRHYDCEHPDGVESFFDLNFFRRWLEMAPQ